MKSNVPMRHAHLEEQSRLRARPVRARHHGLCQTGCLREAVIGEVPCRGELRLHEGRVAVAGAQPRGRDLRRARELRAAADDAREFEERHRAAENGGRGVVEASRDPPPGGLERVDARPQPPADDGELVARAFEIGVDGAHLGNRGAERPAAVAGDLAADQVILEFE